MSTAPPVRATRSPAFLAAAACFFTSGTAALLYEVVWTRLLGLVFGHTVHAVTTVLAAYMGGLALGSWLAGRRADRIARPLRAYALLEGAIGLVCAATPLLFRLTEAIYLPVYRAWQPGAGGAAALHLGLAGVVLLPPTALMGATLPVLSRAVVEEARLAASRVGTLYAVNTWGAVAGTALTGFVLVPAIGLRATVALGVGLNLLVAGAALLLERSLGARPSTTAPRPGTGAAERRQPTEATGEPLSRVQLFVALAGIAVSGAASMAYQVAWTRALGLVLGSSTYAFTAMLATFLVGLALGALVVSRLLRRRPAGLAAFGLVELAIALLAVALLPAFGRIPDAELWLFARTGVTHGAALGAQLLLSFAVLIAPTLAIGATFPLLVSAVGPSLGRVGRDVGVIYGWNTLGTIAGSVLAGFALVPAIGIEGTVRVGAAANVLAGLTALAVARAATGRAPAGSTPAVAVTRARVLGAVLALAVLVVAMAQPRWDPRWMTAGVPVYATSMVGDGPAAVRRAQERRELLFYAEGLSTTVAVSRTPLQTSLSVNGKTDAGTGRDMGTQLLLGHLGALLVPEPRRALVIGLASGITAGAVAQHPFEGIDVAEIEPAMIRASAFFTAENHDVLADPRVRVLEGDGRQIVAAALEPYDLVVSEPSNPWIAGVANLFTREFYQAARRRLAPGGVFVQWLQAYAIFPDELRLVVRTFRSVFPHVTLWSGSSGDLLLVATPGEACLDPALLERRRAASPGLAADLARSGWDGGRLAYRFRLGEADLARFAGEGRVNTDDLPLLEFAAPRALHAVRGSDDNRALLRGYRADDRPCVKGTAPGPAGAEDRLEAASALLDQDEVPEAEVELRRMGPPGALPPGLRAQRARLLFEVGRFAEAHAELSAVVAVAPADPVVRSHLATLAALHEPAAAAQVANALVVNAGALCADPGLLGDYVLGLARKGRPAEALPVALGLLERAARLAPGRLPVLNAYAVALFEAGRQDEALSWVRRAVSVEPTDPRTRFNLAILLERAGRIEDALAELNEVSRLDPRWLAPRERAARLRASRAPSP